MHTQTASWTTAFRAEQASNARPGIVGTIVMILYAAGIAAITGWDAPLPVLHGTDAAGGTTLRFELFRAENFGLLNTPGMHGLVLAFIASCMAGVVRPFLAWHQQGPRSRGYLWSLPISRTRAHLARVAAGAVQVAVFSVATMVVAVLALTLAGRVSSLGVLTFASWISMITGPLTLYLLFSVATILSDRPVRVTVVVLVGFFTLFALTNALGFSAGYALLDAIVGGALGYSTAISGGLIPPLAGAAVDSTWWLAALLWLGIGAVAVYAAARKYQER